MIIITFHGSKPEVGCGRCSSHCLSLPFRCRLMVWRRFLLDSYRGQTIGGGILLLAMSPSSGHCPWLGLELPRGRRRRSAASERLKCSHHIVKVFAWLWATLLVGMNNNTMLLKEWWVHSVRGRWTLFCAVLAGALLDKHIFNHFHTPFRLFLTSDQSFWFLFLSAHSSLSTGR